MLTIEDVRDTVPTQSKNNVTQAMVDQLNALSKNPEEARIIQSNFITFKDVLTSGKYKLADYVRAVMYVSHKLMSKSNLEAYKATFPERYQKMVAEGRADKDIASYVSAYNKGQLVTKITETAAVPTWLLNQDIHQEAVNTQYYLMTSDDVSHKVRSDAANSLLTHLKRPDMQHSELKIDINMNDGMKALEARIAEMAEIQSKAIESEGVTVEGVAAMPLNIEEAEVID